jgi:hypothetical protein
MRYEKYMVENNSRITEFYEIFAILYEKTSNYHRKLG